MILAIGLLVKTLKNFHRSMHLDIDLQAEKLDTLINDTTEFVGSHAKNCVAEQSTIMFNGTEMGDVGDGKFTIGGHGGKEKLEFEDGQARSRLVDPMLLPVVPVFSMSCCRPS
ncbi:hypothetical protein PanWU01x14_102150 [Parasponia andersonii]|uniref:Uncharacterized protein n=1 Tax=Parasponia andersonii TaxID=3476 RepID=A0A2P5D2S8_PARAD|nr:hypothetical protein PanWU01x14_102150 [Parasponia andersonii]